MSHSNFRDRWLPLFVFPAFLSLAVNYIFGHLFSSGLADALTKQCQPNSTVPTPYLLPYTNNSDLNSGICGVVAFFQEAMSDRLGRTYLLYMITSGSIFAIFLYLEASRTRRSALIAYPSLWLLLGQVITIGATIPLYWLTFLLTGNNTRAATKEDKKITQAHAEAILFALTVGGIIPSFAMMHLQDPEVTAVWQVYPLIMGFAGTVHLFIRNPRKISESGYTIVQLLLLSCFMLCSSLHISMVWARDLESLKAIYVPSTHIPQKTRTGLKTLHFLQWDFTIAIASTMVATLWFAKSTRHLLTMVVWYGAGTLVVGPSAAITAVVLWREAQYQ
ncbi:hypothetical protein CC1G_05156 [Coprinopsis cinerea okayama7|uniref:Uncharacterized protein n=1 Tax=Coprinopsis cinerea (strain Okayama-7 / 130 / ATCC MYA-4618 / FGSC 9003) TaxID=240176 RepID=A8NG23_COPC7|nr:hypothetical protein CC1G_05156 [Coprinopsis cinerea okayama7\|eukprot:XP_001833456.1 hypothetical protein CC1G_05156 [Coprinopsis cinerea okayama7\